MAERLLELGSLSVHALGPEAGPAILLCHGFGAPGTDLVPLAEECNLPGVRWFFPEAPLDLWDQGIPGRAWWPIDMMQLQLQIMTGRVQELLERTPEGLAEARAALEGAIQALVRDHGVARGQLLLGGFSQGAMLTTEVALHAAEPFAGLAILSGTLVSAERWRAAAARAGPGLQVLQSHGRADPLLPYAAAERLRDLLQQAGAQVQFVPHGGGHEIPLSVLQALRAFARARLGL